MSLNCIFYIKMYSQFKRNWTLKKKLSLILYNPWNKLEDLYTIITKCQARAILFIYFNYLDTNLQ